MNENHNKQENPNEEILEEIIEEIEEIEYEPEPEIGETALEEEETEQETTPAPVEKIYFDLRARAFYSSAIHTDIPQEAVEITAAQHSALLDAINAGHVVFDDLSISPPRPSPYHEMDEKTRTWKISDAAKKEQLADAKTAKLAQVKEAAQTFISAAAGLDIVPEFEQATWPLQAAEALAWEQDPNADTPVIAKIAAARGTPLNTLRAGALRKSKTYEALAAHAAGQRQALEDQIAAADSIEALAEIAIAITAPAA